MHEEMIISLEGAICKVANEIEANNMHQATDTKLIVALAVLVIARALIR